MRDYLVFLNNSPLRKVSGDVHPRQSTARPTRLPCLVTRAQRSSWFPVFYGWALSPCRSSIHSRPDRFQHTMSFQGLHRVPQPWRAHRNGRTPRNIPRSRPRDQASFSDRRIRLQPDGRFPASLFRLLSSKLGEDTLSRSERERSPFGGMKFVCATVRFRGTQTGYWSTNSGQREGGVSNASVCSSSAFRPFVDLEVHKHEIPGGQLTNTMFQAQQLGLDSHWLDTPTTIVSLRMGGLVRVNRPALTAEQTQQQSLLARLRLDHDTTEHDLKNFLNEEEELRNTLNKLQQNLANHIRLKEDA